MKLDRWLTIAEAHDAIQTASGMGVSRRTLRRRLWALHHQAPGGILKRLGPRKLLVSADALQRALRTDPDLRDAELEGLAARIEEHETKLLALRNALRSLKARVKVVEDRRA